MELSSAAHHHHHHHPFSHQPLQFLTQSSNPTPTNHSFNNSPDFSESLENMIMTTKSPADSNSNSSQNQNQNQNQVSEQKKLRPPETEPQQCPRCESTNTKFCYYNNYSLSQPRYFCKACRRYWTKGGTLRNVPVGGGCRKSAKRAASNSPSQFLKRPHTSDDHAPSPVFSGVHGYSAGMLSPNFTELDGGLNNFFGQQAFLHYGNGGGFMFENSSNLCNNYEEVVGGNSNSEVAALAAYGEQVKQENAAFWEHPWRNGIVSSIGEGEAVRDNWNGLYANYSAMGLLNTPALM